MEEYKPVPKSETAATVALAEGIEIEGLATQEYTISFRYVNDESKPQNEDMGKSFEGYLSITEGKPTNFTNRLLVDNPTILIRTDFDSVFTEENTGTLYKASGNETEDGSDVYYFAGNAQNNWVKFGKDQDDADLYWRIIRTNEDGSVRLLYVGPDPATESAFIKIDGTIMIGEMGEYNTMRDDKMYVGYMYGSEGSLENNRLNTTSAPIKEKTDEWYSKTLNLKEDVSGNTYDSYVSRTAIYCNDRSGDAYASSGNMFYAASNRLMSMKFGFGGINQPTYRCGYNTAGGYFKTGDWPSDQSSWINQSVGMYNDADATDKFSASITNGGNGQLQYPIAQITADEIVYAGGSTAGSFNTNEAKTWYYYNSVGNSAVSSDSWWTMSPAYFNGSNGPGYFVGAGVSSKTMGIRPVLSLKSCVKYLAGDGSSNTLYEVTIDSTCASLEN